MTAGRPAGAPSAVVNRGIARRCSLPAAGEYREGGSLLVYSGRPVLATLAVSHRVLQPNQVLEPCAGKLARTVPRGRGTGNRPLLPGPSAGDLTRV
jgi:hypothetical protein